VELGMTPMQAIRAGTVVNAELLGMESDIGSIEPGRLADIIAVDGDPLVDIGALGDVRYVMLGGRIVRSPGAPESGYPEAGR
jgi:imidazolonepropionase-like amidohydrolase